MFAGLLSLLRFFIQFAYPIHDALTSYQRQDEKGFAVLVKYFFMTTIALLLETLLKPIFNSSLFQLVFLGLTVALILNDYSLSAIAFDFFEKKYATIGGSKIEKLINVGADYLNSVLKWFTRHVYKPSKFFVKKQIQRFFTKSVFGGEKEDDSDDDTKKEDPVDSRPAEPQKKHGKKRLE